MRGVLAATAETEHVLGVVLTAPLQALARLHTAAATGLVDDGVARPAAARRVRRARSCTDLGPAPDAAEVAARLRAVSDVLLATPRLPVVVAAAVVHAELATVRPFVRGNAVVARALDRAVVHAGGLDPTGVAVTEAGHGAQGGAAYLGALAAYGRGDVAGVGLWIIALLHRRSRGGGRGRAGGGCRARRTARRWTLVRAGSRGVERVVTEPLGGPSRQSYRGPNGYPRAGSPLMDRS